MKGGESIGEMVDRGALVPWDKNPRRNGDAVVAVMRSITKFGFASPIIARKSDGRVIAGHTRLEAADRLKLEQVPVRWMELDDNDAAALAIADNKLGELADWDDEKLRTLLGEMNEADLDVLGFDDFELEALLGDWKVPDLDEASGEIVDQDRETIRVKVSLSDLGAARDAIRVALDAANIEAEL